MKKKNLGLYIIIPLVFVGCKTNKQHDISDNSFQVISPIISDTSYTHEYVADIHAVQNVEIRTRVKGYIEAIYVDEGEHVKKGQLLFSISNKRHQEIVAKAKASLKLAQAEVKAAELELQNAKILVEKNIVSSSKLELAQAKLDGANAKVDEAKAVEAEVSLNLSFTEIKAPFDGVLNRIPNKTGSLVAEGTLLTSISNNKEVYAYFNVSEGEYLDFIAEQENTQKSDLELILANNKIHRYKGVIETVDGEIDKTTGNISFRARFANPEGVLKQGSSGKVRLKNELKSALLIPQKSTFELQDMTYVYAVDSNNVVERKAITPTFRFAKFYVVNSGLISTDKIIYEGIQRIKEGDTIIPQLISGPKTLATNND